MVQHNPRADPGPGFLRVDLHQLIQVLAEIHHNGVVHGLPGKAGAAAPGKHWNAVVPGYLNHCLNVVNVPGDDDPDRVHPVDAGVGGIKNSGIVVEAHLAIDAPPQQLGQFFPLPALYSITRGNCGGHGWASAWCPLSVIGARPQNANKSRILGSRSQLIPKQTPLQLDHAGQVTRRLWPGDSPCKLETRRLA